MTSVTHMERTYTVKVIVSEEDTGVIYAETDDGVKYNDLATTIKQLRSAVIERVNAGLDP